MRILEKIIKRLEGYDPDREYFEFKEKERDNIVSLLWDEVYGNYYLQSLKGKTSETPLRVQINILTYLMTILNEYEQNEQFEICDVVLKLIQITENKITQLDRYYATTK